METKKKSPNKNNSIKILKGCQKTKKKKTIIVHFPQEDQIWQLKTYEDIF